MFECYIRSEPERKGYRKRLLDLWKTHNTNNEQTEVTQQRLADQVCQIKCEKWLETVELEEITLRVNSDHQSIESTDSRPTDTPNHGVITLEIQEEHQRVDNVTAEEEPSSPPAEEPQEEVNPELDVLCDRIQEVMNSEQRVRLPSLRSFNSTKFRVEVGKVDEAMKRIQTNDFNELNSLLYAAAYVTTERMGMLKERSGKRTEESFWRRRIKRNIETWRKDLSKIEEV